MINPIRTQMPRLTLCTSGDPGSPKQTEQAVAALNGDKKTAHKVVNRICGSFMLTTWLS